MVFVFRGYLSRVDPFLFFEKKHVFVLILKNTKIPF